LTRVAAMLRKELLDLRLNPWVMLPAAITGLAALVIPFVITVVVPRLSGQSLADSGDFELALEVIRAQAGGANFDPETAIQAWVLQVFLIFLILIPVIGATSIAAHSVVAEKQARTLEPLLATPITTFELLAAKTIAALVPALGLTLICYAVDLVLIAFFARPGVFGVLLGPRPLLLVLVLGPLAALTALQVAVCVSSRVEDERTAQGIGSFVALPVGVVFVLPLVGLQTFTHVWLGSLVAALVVANILLMRLSIAVFDRESILTRWK
jgi:ABC-2 type transport system permease protein